MPIGPSRIINEQMLKSQVLPQKSDKEVAGSISSKAQEETVSKLIRLMKLGKYVNIKA